MCFQKARTTSSTTSDATKYASTSVSMATAAFLAFLLLNDGHWRVDVLLMGFLFMSCGSAVLWCWAMMACYEWGALSLRLSSSPLQLISTGSSSALLEPRISSNQIPKIPNHQATTNNFLRKTAKNMTILWRRKGEKKTQGYFFPKEVLSTTQKHLKLHLNRTKHYSNAWTLSRVASSSTLSEIAFGIILWLLKTEQWKTKCFSKPLAPLFSIFSLIFLFLFPYVT